jgi:hypothetical protein
MTQEVQVTLTLEVDVTQSKTDIQDFIQGLINTHYKKSSAYNKSVFDFHEEIVVKEEAEIYKTEEL